MFFLTRPALLEHGTASKPTTRTKKFQHKNKEKTALEPPQKPFPNHPEKG